MTGQSILSLALLPGLAFAQTAAAPNFAGKWKVHTSIANTERDSTCTFEQKEKELAGTCELENGPVKVSGTVNGDQAVWSYDSEYSGTPLTAKYTGTLAAGKISGEVTVERFGVPGEFTAAPAE